MPRDTLEFAVAFALGALLGAGTAMVARPEPPGTGTRIRRRLRAPRRRLARSAREFRGAVDSGVREGRRVGRSAGGLGRELVKAVQEEARETLRDSAAGWLRSISSRAGGPGRWNGGGS